MERKGFLGSLFDFSFRDFVTPTIIKIIFGIALFLGAIDALLWIVLGFNAGTGYGILSLILAPLFFLLYAIVVRIALEVTILLFAIKEDVSEIRKGTRQESTEHTTTA